jgi:hypothetical protein
VHSGAVIRRIRADFAPCRAAAFLALAAIACLVLAACSPGTDYPSLFPAVHDIPPPRTDATLDSNQVQQATEDLISARDRLSAEAQSAQSKNATSSAVKPATNTGGKAGAKSGANTGAKSGSKSGSKSPAKAATISSANAPSANATAARTPPNNPAGGRQTLGADAEATVGTETK